MSRTQEQRGQTVLLFTIGLTTMIGLVGLVVDVGWSYYREQAAQAAAEAAALGAAKAAYDSSGGGITCGGRVVCQGATACPSSIPSPPSNNFHNACFYAKDNGFVTGGNDHVYIEANTTTAPVSGVNVSYWVRATVTSSVAQGFSAVLGNFWGTVSKQSTAVILPTSSFGCIYALNTSAGDALDVSGTTTVNAPCGVYVDSNSSTALQVKGTNATLNASPGTISIVGNDTGSNGIISPAPSTGAVSFTDPMASVAAPSWSGCDHSGQVNITLGVATLSPGVYCGGISISGTAVVTFQPGTYVLNGGGLVISSSNAIITGTGVSFYNTGDSGHTYAAISITGGSAITLSAPTSGSQANVLFFEDRAITSSLVNTISGGSTSVLTGVLYFKNSPLAFAGNSISSSIAIVADKVQFTGTSTVNGNLAGGGSGSRIALVE